MSISTLEQKEKRLITEIERLQKSLTSESKKEYDALNKISKAQDTIRRTKSNSTLKSKSSEMDRENKKVLTAKSKQADLNKKITTKTSELNKTRSELAKERVKESKKEQKKIQKQYDEQIESLSAIQSEATSQVKSEIMIDPQYNTKEYDIFISYASEDSEYVDSLFEKMESSDISCWRDQTEIGWGRSIRQSIDAGLVRSKFGIVILSSSYIKKYWTNYELSGILNKESSTGRQMILPIWHNVTKDEIDEKSPSLSDRLALDSRLDSTDDIVNKLKNLLN